MKIKKRWLSSFDKCDICETTLKNKVKYFVDGMLRLPPHPWALMCPECFVKYGVGIGYGKGQKYDGKTGVLLEGGSDETC